MGKGLVLSSIALAALLGLALPHQATAEFRIEAEDCTAWGDLGGVPIVVGHCGGAFGGKAVKGMDYPGDWITIPVTLGENTCLSDSLRNRGQLDLVRDYAVYWIPDPPATTASADTSSSPPGSGVS